jgi:hypothetical protein
MEIITLKEAKEKKLKHYYTGIPCKHGHLTLRYTQDARCCECGNVKMRKYWEKYPEARDKRNAKFRDKKITNPNVYVQELKQKKIKWHSDAEFRQKQMDLMKLRYQEYKKNPEYVKKINAKSREYAKNNRPLLNAKMARRKALQIKATPKWADLNIIKEIYKTCPQGYHVDHIIPLRGKNVCGLHVEFNLQHLPAKENLSKGNRLTLTT